MHTFRPCRRLLFTALFLTPFALILAAGCDSRSEPAKPGHSSGFDAEAITDYRLEKDKALREHDSPIPAAQRADFPGLPYYPPTEKFVVPVSLEKFPSSDTVEIAASGGEMRKLLRYGRFALTIDGQHDSLTVYKHIGNATELFIPFRDATNGKQTYEVGRYLEIEEKPGEDHYLLDFNYAYSPYCAYNPDYTCPLVPRENILLLAIEAGEKVMPESTH